MTPTRKYLNKDVGGETKLLATAIALLIFGAVLGGLIWINVEVWPAIFD